MSYFIIQVSRVSRLIPSLGRPAASLARAVHSVSTECSLRVNRAFCAYAMLTFGRYARRPAEACGMRR